MPNKASGEISFDGDSILLVIFLKKSTLCSSYIWLAGCYAYSVHEQVICLGDKKL